jgi:type IV pilus assembly protein PilY1
VAPGDPADTFKVDAKANNELWSFLPPHVLPHLLPTYDQQAILLDGAPVVRDVVLERTLAQAIAGGQAGGAQWRTVLLAGGGAGGGFYYALDVTDPSAPTFLWQLSTDDAGAPLFGKSTPTPAIATVAIKDQSGALKEVAVAILPGGSAPLNVGACPRLETDFPHIVSPGGFTPRDSVRCWGEPGAPTTGPARSLTIVRLDTGEVLMNFRGAAGDGPANLGNRTKIAAFDSPVTGTPVAYPSQVGQVADRVYVGDSDGTLWRVNLTSLSPQDWSVELAWDAYSSSIAGDTALSGEPIQTPPVISIDSIGNTVILFSTGDQELLTASDVKTRVWSITEKTVGSDFIRSENWLIPFTDGKRVTGPISLFDSVAYFATYTPPIGGAAACAYGFGSIWGVHYTKKWQDDITLDPTLPAGAQGPFPQAKYACTAADAGCASDPASPTSGVTYAKDQPLGTTVFGVAIAQTPSCYDDTQDPFYGPVWTLGQVSHGEHRLVYQTGKGGTATEGSVTKTVDESLPRPKSFAKVDSWASIVE